jgi:CBS domain-containing protein
MIETIGSILKIKGSEIWALPPEATVYDAIALMAEKGVGAILVISGGTLVGIVSERDYARKVILQGRSSKQTQVWQIMTRSLVTVTSTHSIDECMRIMTQCRIRHLPVLESGKLVGILSIGDLVNAVISDQAHTIHQLHSYIGSTYPG